MSGPLPYRLTRHTAVGTIIFCGALALLLLGSTMYFPSSSNSNRKASSTRVSPLGSLACPPAPIVPGEAPKDLCSVAPALDALNERWGTNGLDMTVAHSGSGLRMRRALARLVKSAPGEKFVIAVVGGSITFGHGLKHGDKTWPTLIQDRLRELYPDVQIEVANGAVAATGTDYFSHCYSHHIPKNADIFIDEAAVNDVYVAENANANQRTPIVEYTENLMRDWLRQSDGTAVMMVSTWLPDMAYINGADRHAIVSAYYDIPRVSSRPFLYPYLLQNPGEKGTHFAPDGHPNQNGHQYLADIVLRYLLQQICTIEAAERRAASDPTYRPNYNRVASHQGFGGSGLNYSLSPFAYPEYRISQRYGSKHKPEMEHFPEVEASCQSANVVTEDGKWQLQPKTMEGFEQVAYHDKHYYGSEKPGSTITFHDIHVHSGSLGIYYLRQGDEMGNMLCWVDGNKAAPTKLVGYWRYVSVGSIGVIAEGLHSGTHWLTCEVMEETQAPNNGTRVRIIAIVST